jgi:hypothetical protein
MSSHTTHRPVLERSFWGPSTVPVRSEASPFQQQILRCQREILRRMDARAAEAA